MIKLLMILLICGIVISHAASAREGDKLTFYLNAGRIVKGVFIRIDGFLVRVSTKDSEKVFFKSSISRIERTGKIVSLDDVLGKSLEGKQNASYQQLPARFWF